MLDKNQELQSYIDQSYQAGKTDDQIRHELLGVGWEEEDINVSLQNKKNAKPLTLKNILYWILPILLFILPFIIIQLIVSNSPHIGPSGGVILFDFLANLWWILALAIFIPYLAGFFEGLLNKPERIQLLFLPIKILMAWACIKILDRILLATSFSFFIVILIPVAGFGYIISSPYNHGKINGNIKKLIFILMPPLIIYVCGYYIISGYIESSFWTPHPF